MGLMASRNSQTDTALLFIFAELRVGFPDGITMIITLAQYGQSENIFTV